MGCGSSVSKPPDTTSTKVEAARRPDASQPAPSNASSNPSPPPVAPSSRPSSSSSKPPASQAPDAHPPSRTSPSSPSPSASRPPSAQTTSSSTLAPTSESAPPAALTADSASTTASSLQTRDSTAPPTTPPISSFSRGNSTGGRDQTSSSEGGPAQALTDILTRQQHQQQHQQGPQQSDGSTGIDAGKTRGRSQSGGAGSGGGGGSGLGEEVEALLGAAGRFPDLLKELMDATTQVLLPLEVDPEDAEALHNTAGCPKDDAVRLLECLAVVRAAAAALDDAPAPSCPSSSTIPGSSPPDPQSPPRAQSSTVAEAPLSETPADSAAGELPGTTAAAAAARGPGGSGGGSTPTAPPAAPESPGPTPQQLTRQLGALSGLLSDCPGLRTGSLVRGAHDALLRVLLSHPERAAAANAALALASLAAGPPPHKTTLIAAGAVDALLQAARGGTAAAAISGAAACGGVTANACSALAQLVSGHAAGAAAVAAADGIPTLLGLLSNADAPPNVRTNAAGVLVQLTAMHESYRAAIVAAGGVAALAAGMLRGPDAPACNVVTALYNLAALTPPHLRPAMAALEGPHSIVRQLLCGVAGRNATGGPDESVAAASAARVNASAVLLELCKDSAAAPSLADTRLAVPSALAALAAGRLPPPPPGTPTAAAEGQVDILSSGVDALYPVPPVVRGNCLLGLMALARLGPDMQMELGRCGALGTLLELLAPGQDPAMQVNAANALCSLAAANADIHSALVAARCVPLLVGLLAGGGDAARANVCAVLTTMMRDEGARQQLQDCGALTALMRLMPELLNQRLAAGGGGSAPDPGGVLCNAVGALAEGCKYPDLRRSVLQVEFGESLGALLRCLREAPEPAQVNAAAACCHLCRETPAAVQLGRLGAVEKLRAIVQPGAAADCGQQARGASARLVHNASRALSRLEDQLAAVAAKGTAADLAASNGAAIATGKAANNTPGGGDDVAPGATSTGSELRPSPRGVWDTTGAAESARAAGAVAGMRDGGGATDRANDMKAGAEDDEEADDVSTVILPPLPLGAL